MEVYARDGWKCKVCGGNGRIEAHHIYPLRTNFEKRLELSNGITLCFYHHRLIFGKELRLVKFFTDLIKINGVNSVKLLNKDNTEPSREGNLTEGVTTRSQRYFLEQFISRQVPCASCGKLLKRHYYRIQRAKKYYCNHICRSNYLTGKKGKDSFAYKEKIIQYCIHCGKETSTPANKRRIKKYCNNTCQMAYQRELKKAGNASTKTLPERDDIV